MVRHATRFIGIPLLLALSISSGCSSDKNSPSGGGGGGNTREFVSGDLGNGESFQHVFATAGAFGYYCRYHGAAGGVGMSGTITVSGTGTPVTNAFSITNNTLPSVTIHINDTVKWTNNTAMVHTVESDN